MRSFFLRTRNPWGFGAGRWRRCRAGFGFWPGAVVACGMWLVVHAAVPDQPTPARDTNEFRLFTTTLTLLEGGTLTNYCWNVGTNRFAFRAPARWSVRADAAGRKLDLLDGEVRAGVTVRFQPRTKPGEAPEGPAALRERLKRARPAAQWIEESVEETGCGAGPVFQLEVPLEKGIRAAIRVVFIPMSDGLLEFELRTTAELLEGYLKAFGRVLHSFCRQSELEL